MSDDYILEKANQLTATLVNHHFDGSNLSVLLDAVKENDLVDLDVFSNDYDIVLQAVERILFLNKVNDFIEQPNEIFRKTFIQETDLRYLDDEQIDAIFETVNVYLKENPLEPNIDNLKKAFDFLCELNFCTDDLEAYDELLQHDVIPTECIVLTSIYDWVQFDDKYQTNYEAIDDFIDDSSFNFYDQANELVNQVKDLLVQSNENQVTKSRGR